MTRLASVLHRVFRHEVGREKRGVGLGSGGVALFVDAPRRLSAETWLPGRRVQPATRAASASPTSWVARRTGPGTRAEPESNVGVTRPEAVSGVAAPGRGVGRGGGG